MKNKVLKVAFILLNMLFIFPSIIYLVRYKTIVGFNEENNFLLIKNVNCITSTTIYLILFISLMILYSIILKRKVFKNIKQILIFIMIIGGMYLFMLPWTSSDIFYYMGVGELNSVYHQNPYYVTMKDYYEQNNDEINDEIMETGANNCWAPTTVVYGPIAQMIFSFCSLISFKNATVALFVYKTINLIVHIANCYIMYKLTKKKIFPLMYGINPFVLLELIGNVHNDVIIIFFVLMSLYFLLKRRDMFFSIVFLAFATGIKYYTILLLPVILLYYFRNEKLAKNRILKSVEYVILFLLIFLLEYIPYFEDFSILFAGFPQVDRCTKSIYEMLGSLNDFGILLSTKIRYLVLIIFLTVSFYIYTRFLFGNNKIINMLRKYNIILILAMLLLSNCQIWYFTWFFATIMYQSSRCQKNIIAFSAIAEIANSTYMIYLILPNYANCYICMIIILFCIWNLFLDLYYKRKRKRA